MSAGRRSFAGSLVFCSSNGDALRLLARNAAKYCASHKELAALQLWPPDGDRWCECERCRALGDPTDRQARTVAAVAEAVSKARPEIKVEFLAYSKYTSPPGDMIFPANTILDFAPIGRSFQYDIFEPGAVNERYANALKNWVKEYRGDMSIYTYYAKYAWNSLPNNIPHRIAREVKWYASLGIQGMSIYSEPASWLALEQNQYLVSKLPWRNDFDVDGYLDEWRRHRFGAAAEPMREYFRLMEEIVPGACSIPGTAVASLRVLRPFLAKAERCATLLALAKEQAGSDPCARFFIEKTQRCLDYVRADLALRQGRLARLPREEMNKRLAALKRILEANADTGVFCDYSTFERYRSRYAGDKRISRDDPNWRLLYGKWALADGRVKGRDGGLAVLLWKKVDSAGRRFAVEVKYEILAESGNRNALIIFGHDQEVDDWYCAGVAAAQGNIIIGRCNRGESRLHVLKSANFDKAKSGSGIMRLLVDFDAGRVGVSLKVADKWASVLDADLPELRFVQPRIGLGAKGSSCAFSDFTVTPMP